MILFLPFFFLKTICNIFHRIYDNIIILCVISDNMDYYQILDLNNTVIT